MMERKYLFIKNIYLSFDQTSLTKKKNLSTKLHILLQHDDENQQTLNPLNASCNDHEVELSVISEQSSWHHPITLRIEK